MRSFEFAESTADSVFTGSDEVFVEEDDDPYEGFGDHIWLDSD